MLLFGKPIKGIWPRSRLKIEPAPAVRFHKPGPTARSITLQLHEMGGARILAMCWVAWPQDLTLDIAAHLLQLEASCRQPPTILHSSCLCPGVWAGKQAAGTQHRFTWLHAAPQLLSCRNHCAHFTRRCSLLSTVLCDTPLLGIGWSCCPSQGSSILCPDENYLRPNLRSRRPM